MINPLPLHDVHVQASARFVDFHGWEMPVNYGSQFQEHQQVRSHAGVFDVSHMTIVDIQHVNNLCILAVQGPASVSILADIFEMRKFSELLVFSCTQIKHNILCARTGIQVKMVVS